jgi:tetratricopeptide (TPR) repeat protein
MLSEAIGELREAIRLKPDIVAAHNNLGIALRDQGKLSEAIAAYREAIRLQPGAVEPHHGLAVALTSQGKLEEAIVQLREAIRIRPDFANARISLGVALMDQGKVEEAITEYRTAIRLKPDYALTHYNLGSALRAQEKVEEAIAEYHTALRLKPDYAEVHCNLGHVLRQQGRYAEALSEIERGHALGSQRTDWPYPSAEWVRQARVLVGLEGRLPALLQAKDLPANADETLTLADLCYQKELHAASARFWLDVFQKQPALAEDLKSGNRYNAACAAALAGGGKGQDEPRLDNAAKARWRTQARDWLKADLAAWAKALVSGPPTARTSIQQNLQHWKTDSDLAGIRDGGALAKLPADEQKACGTLWAEVDAMLTQAGGRPSR